MLGSDSWFALAEGLRCDESCWKQRMANSTLSVELRRLQTPTILRSNAESLIDAMMFAGTSSMDADAFGSLNRILDSKHTQPGAIRKACSAVEDCVENNRWRRAI